MPPGAGAASRTTTRAPCARALPRGGEAADAGADDGEVDPLGHAPASWAAVRTRSASSAITAGSSLIDAVRAKARPASPATRRGVDVEVVEHLEVVGHEPLGAHQHPAGLPAGGQVADHVEHVGTAPRLGRATGRLPRQRPAGSARRGRHRPGDGGRRLGQLVRVRVVGQHPLGQRVGREQHLGALGQAAQRRAHALGLGVDPRRHGVATSRSGTYATPRSAAASPARAWYSPTDPRE